MEPVPMTQHFYKTLLDNLYEGVYYVDNERRITYWNKAAETISGYAPGEMEGSCCWDNKLMHINDAGMQLCQGQCPLAKTIADGKMRVAEVYLHHKEGHRVPVSVCITPIIENGVILGAVEIFRDNSPHRFIEQKTRELSELAFLDQLTRLGNRHYLDNHIRLSFEEFTRAGTPFGLILMGLDNLSDINDARGNAIGDRVLLMASNTITANLRPLDIAGRWSGGEFIIMVRNMKDEEYLFSFANRFRILVEKSNFMLGNEKIQVTVSAGAVIARKIDTPEMLLQRAETLLSRSRDQGGNRVSIG